MARKPGERIRDYSIEPSRNKFGPKAVNPHSPWQLLIEKSRKEKKIPLRELATRAQIPSGTLFNWVRAKKGAPPRISYTANLNRRIATALGIEPEHLADAYNSSAFKPVDHAAIEMDPRPAPQLRENADAVDGLDRLLHVLRAAGRQTFTLTELGMLISMLTGTTDKSVRPLDESEGK